MSGWLAGRVIENRRWTQALFSLRVEAPALAFEAGQFVRIALDIGQERVARPFSFVNPPADPVLEFYGIVVPGGPLSPRLARLAPGDGLWVADNPSGFLTVGEAPAAQDLWLIATGTGIAPFLSILRSPQCWARFARIVLVHGVRTAAELAYRELSGELRAAKTASFAYVPFVSREAVPGAQSGRIPAAIGDGRLEAAAGPIGPDRSAFMLCGNPDMLRDVTAALAQRGLRKHRRRRPGHIIAEGFW
jgi:ferredoxin--NADP+ reductase